MRFGLLSIFLAAGCATAPVPEPGLLVGGPSLAELCEAPERQLGGDRVSLIKRLGRPRTEH